MDSKELLKIYFEEQFNNTSQIFLYKDKKMLNEGRYIEFAKSQIKKANSIFYSVTFSLALCSLWGIISLIEYGANAHLFDLGVGLASWAGLIFIVFYSSKEYFTIKSSMHLFIKMYKQHEADK